MIARMVNNVKLEGPVLTAFKSFCQRHGCVKTPEGIRAMIRELPEYRELEVSGQNGIKTDEPQHQD